jgi:hypothetical protein
MPPQKGEEATIPSRKPKQHGVKGVYLGGEWLDIEVYGLFPTCIAPTKNSFPIYSLLTDRIVLKSSTYQMVVVQKIVIAKRVLVPVHVLVGPRVMEVMMS